MEIFVPTDFDSVTRFIRETAAGSGFNYSKGFVIQRRPQNVLYVRYGIHNTYVASVDIEEKEAGYRIEISDLPWYCDHDVRNLTADQKARFIDSLRNISKRGVSE